MSDNFCVSVKKNSKDFFASLCFLVLPFAIMVSFSFFDSSPLKSRLDHYEKDGMIYRRARNGWMVRREGSNEEIYIYDPRCGLFDHESSSEERK